MQKKKHECQEISLTNVKDKHFCKEKLLKNTKSNDQC